MPCIMGTRRGVGAWEDNGVRNGSLSVRVKPKTTDFAARPQGGPDSGCGIWDN